MSDVDQNTQVAPNTDHDVIASIGGTPSSATPRLKRSRSANAVASILPPIVMGIAVLGGWYLVSYGLLDASRRFLLRPPHQVVQVGFLEWENLSEMLSGLWSSTRIAIIGLAISIVLGFLLATIMSQAKIAERAMFPYLVMLQAIPILAIIPLIQFWWGSGEPIWDYPIVSYLNSRVIVCVIISIFPIIVNTLFGLQSAERGMHDLFTLHHASRLTRLRKLMFPAAMPAIFAGLRISAGLSVIGAIVGDFFLGRGEVGIGQLLKKYANNLQGEELLAAVILSSALGVAVFLFFGWLQTFSIGKWHEAGSD
ncbi:MAG: ABC transporter permease subunit [Ilumatobacteraceae bacterium]|nr:ABC transporter permease subunit [Ilumatobacteraceae bacterium]